MTFSNFAEDSEILNRNFEARKNHLDLWKDLLDYSDNLQGNWLFSKQIFYNRIVPTAEKDPAKFAKWVKNMVKESGIKIKSKSEFIEAINYLRKMKGKDNKSQIKKALYCLLESGLEKPVYALKALNNKVI